MIVLGKANLDVRHIIHTGGRQLIVGFRSLPATKDIAARLVGLQGVAR